MEGGVEGEGGTGNCKVCSENLRKCWNGSSESPRFRKDDCFSTLTLPETNIAMENTHHFDGIYQERWDFHGAMLVSGSVLF